MGEQFTENIINSLNAESSAKTMDIFIVNICITARSR